MERGLGSEFMFMWRVRDPIFLDFCLILFHKNDKISFLQQLGKTPARVCERRRYTYL